MTNDKKITIVFPSEYEQHIPNDILHIHNDVLYVRGYDAIMVVPKEIWDNRNKYWVMNGLHFDQIAYSDDGLFFYCGLSF